MTKDEALKLALETLECWQRNQDCNEPMSKILEAIKEALAQPEQKPVAWMNDSTPSGIFARHIDGAKNFGCTIPLYTTPPQRTWVNATTWRGLTDSEIGTIAYNVNPLDGIRQFSRAIEAKLKEKNNV